MELKPIIWSSWMMTKDVWSWNDSRGYARNKQASLPQKNFLIEVPYRMKLLSHRVENTTNPWRDFCPIRHLDKKGMLTCGFGESVCFVHGTAVPLPLFFLFFAVPVKRTPTQASTDDL